MTTLAPAVDVAAMGASLSGPPDRRSRILTGLRVASAPGIEIGPLYSPILTKAEADILYVDHADTATLRTKYAAGAAVPADRIVEVDAIWGDRTLREAVGTDRRFGYILASHVVEHVPDLVGWLNELIEVLDRDGEIRLVVPDKRFTFDHLRRGTRLAEVLAAHVVRARAPQPFQVLDFLTQFSSFDVADAWAGRQAPGGPPVDAASCACWLDKAREALAGDYVDVHCWVFTPSSFAGLLIELTEAGLVGCECALFDDTLPGTFEFIVGLRPCSDRARMRASWFDMLARAADDNPRNARQIGLRRQDAIAETEARCATLLAELQAAKAETAQLRASKSWRITSPLRSLRSVLVRAVGHQRRDATAASGQAATEEAQASLPR